MFYDRQCVGDLTVRPSDLRAGRPVASFKVLVATAMFQRHRDAQVVRILCDLPECSKRLCSPQRSAVGGLTADPRGNRLDRTQPTSGCPEAASVSTGRNPWPGLHEF